MEKEQKPQQQATGGEGSASYFRTASKERVQADGSTKQVDSKKLETFLVQIHRP
jgi:hypothetical protein